MMRTTIRFAPPIPTDHRTMAPPTALRITTGARLHFGPLTNGARRGRHFGGIGVMLDAPRLTLELALAERDEIAADEPLASKIAACRDAVRTGCDFHAPLRIALLEQPRPHSGLGTGTQLAMAVAQAIALLAGRGAVDVAQLARWVGRGKRSALGVHGFVRGGFLVDGGKQSPDALGTLVARHDLPQTWRAILVTPETHAGLSGTAEEETFRQLEAMPESTTDRLCRLVLLDILPAIGERDFDRFSAALYEYGALVGDYFSAVQGGRYAHPQTAALIEWLRTKGIAGVGQSSWGPTLFAFCPNALQADELRSELAASDLAVDCRIHIAAPLNTGAAIELE